MPNFKGQLTEENVIQLIAYPSFKKQYGSYYPDLDEYLISASWQVGLGNAASCGSIIGLLINGYVTEKFGHRLVIMAGLVIMSGFKDSKGDLYSQV